MNNINSEIKYRLGVVDEQDEDIEEFFSYFDDYFTPIKIEIGVNIEDAINDIIKKKVDAVAIDYWLKEHDQHILYNGNDLFKELTEQMAGFPIFLMTSYPDEAKTHNIDAFRIFSKKIMQPDPQKILEYKKGLELVDRIKMSIINYHDEINEKENRIDELLSIAEKRELTHPEEIELIKLDTFFEKIYDGKHSVPSDLKTITNEKKLLTLLNKVDKLISKFNEKN